MAKSAALVGFVVLAFFSTSAFGAMLTFSGSLSSAFNEIDGEGAWVNPGPTTISWEVTEHATFWHYKYILTVPDAASDVSHFIIEVSDNFGVDDFWGDTGPHSKTEIGTFDQANGNPNIPGSVFGLKFDDTSGGIVTIEFDSRRVPVWGDFYAKGGGTDPVNQAWNAGFTILDPDDPAGNGSLDNHILVPDSIVPEPTTLALVIGGAVLGSLRRWRRR